MIKGLFIFLFISTPVYSMTVDAFIFADTIIEASNMPNTSLTDKEKVEASNLNNMIRQNLSGIIDGVLIMNQTNGAEFGVKLICPSGKNIDTEQFKRQLINFWDSQPEWKKVKLAKSRLSTLTMAFLIKKYPCP